MFLALFLSALAACAHAQDDNVQYAQSVKSVKGGGGGWQYSPNVNYDRFYEQGFNMRQNMSQHGYNMSQNTTRHGYEFGAHNSTQQRKYEVGVCYIEVPTVQLARDPKHVPAGNGSRPDLSRIRTCCQGYIRNIHNYRICDPVCTHECVNALCTAPETCTCFPDHVKNLAGFCVSTCPIGCQNGHCAGGECLCKQGFKLDSDSKYCIPSCKDNCGGIGNCTAPNTCDCKTGYRTTAEGSCKPVCDRCVNGECVAPNECRCLPGFVRSTDGSCKPACDQCRNGDCVGPNTCRCHSGYINERPGTCVPQCNPGCGPTSRCIAPNVCDPPLTTTSTTPAIHATIYPPLPLYPGNQVQPNPSYPGYPGSQPQPNPSYPGYPGSQPQPNPSYPGYPGSQLQPNPSYPGYPGSQPQPNPSHPEYPGHQFQPTSPYPGYPNNQAQPTNSPYPGYPGNQAQPNPSYPGYSGNQPNRGDVPTDEMCPQPCVNGICVGVNTCRCKPGYYLDSNDPTGTRCLPHCAGGCVNGVCSAPNFCICNIGYYKDTSVKGRPSCVKRLRRSAPTIGQPIAEVFVFETPDYVIDN